MRGPCLIALTTLAAAAPAAAQGLSYEGGIGMSTGRYIFTDRTTTWSLTTGLALESSRLTLRASIPIWLQNSTVVTASGAGGHTPSGGSSGGAVGDGDSGHDGSRGSGRRVDVPSSAFTDYRAAVGDPVVGATALVAASPTFHLRLGAQVKLPLADTSGFGTGAWDYAAQASASLRVPAIGLLGLDAAWWRLGDLPDLELRNPLVASVSVSRSLGTRFGLSLFARGGTAAVAGYAAPISAGAGLIRFDDRGAWGLEMAAGLSETVPDLSLGAYWRVRL